MDNLEDFHQKYHNTWVQYRSDGVLSPALIELIQFGEKLIYIRSLELGIVSIKYTENQLKEKLELSPPQTGYFNYNGHALVLFKIPVRQWRVGLCHENHEIYNPFKYLLNSGVYRPTFGERTVSALFNPAYIPDPQIAYSMFNKSTHSVALSCHLMISKSPTEKHSGPLIWFDCNPCGFIQRSKFVVEDELFRQEIEDELHRLGQEKWIF